MYSFIMLFMAASKRETVFNVCAEQFEQIQEVVRSGRYRSASEFLREAIDEKLERLRQDRVADQVARYCREDLGLDDDGLVESQAFDSEGQSTDR